MSVVRAFVGWTLLCLPGLAAAQPGVAVKLVGNELVAVPGYIAVADVPDSGLRVSSEVADLECFIQFDPSLPLGGAPSRNADRKPGGQELHCEGSITAGVQQYVVFRSGERTAGVALIQPARQVGILTPLLIVLLSVGVAALAMRITLTRRQGTYPDTERLIGEVRELRRCIRKLASKAPPPPLSPSALIAPPRHASDPDQQSSGRQQRDRPTAEPSPAEQHLQRVLDAAVAWSSAVDRVPRSFQDAYRRLENLRGCADAQPQELISQCGHLAGTALNHSDTHSDPHFEHPAIQDALTHLIAAAGLTLVSPSRLDPYDGKLHDVVGRDHSPDVASRSTVSRATRRGLQRADAIVSRAEVRIYD
jgi:hypothetical protein